MSTGKDRRDDTVEHATGSGNPQPMRSAEELRRQAEDKARKIASINPDALSDNEVRNLLHELCVHQIELAMQNEELRHAQSALEASRARYFDLYDLAPVGYVTLSENGSIVEANLRAATLLGVPRGGLVKERLSRSIFPDDQDVYYLHHKKLLETGEPQAYDLRMVRRDGAVFWARMMTTLAPNEASGNPKYRATISDITERKEAEEGRRKLADDLLQSQTKLRALVEDVSRAEERERRRLAMELHDYLAQTLALCRITLSRAGKLKASGDVKRLLAEAQQLVDSSMDYTRTMMVHLSPRVLYDFGLPAALTWLGEKMKPHGLKVAVTGDPAKLDLDEDQAVLAFQCARSLLWNVVKHAHANEATISYLARENELMVQVADDGKGFDLTSMAEHGDGSSKFGLFSVRERLQMQGGRLELKSAPGRGTQAAIWLPTALANKASRELAKSAIVRRVVESDRQLRVELVDDDEVVRRGLRRVLEDHADLSVVGEAKDGLESVEMARELKPDVIVMDINMPRMSGIQATKRILEEFPNTIVVGLSVASDIHIEQGMKKAGASACVTKEHAGEEIYTTIMNAVQERREGGTA